jgi:hypothetical protein
MKRCPFPFCPRPRFHGCFACRGHWERMPLATKHEALDLLRKLDHDDIAMDKFREMRDAIIARCPGAFLAVNDFSQ